MKNLIEMKSELVETLKKLKREIHYIGLSNYVESLKQKEYLNGKESYILSGANSLLKRIEADRRSISLGLISFIPCDESHGEYEEIHTSYLSWDRSVSLIDRE